VNIAVIGPGALGCLFATRLHVAGLSTILVDHRAERARVLSETGLTVESDAGTIVAAPRVELDVPPNTDLVLLLTKATATPRTRIPDGAKILTLQNGLGNAESLARATDADRVLAGSTSEAATLLGPGRVRHAASGVSVFGAWAGGPCGPMRAALEQAGFRVRVVADPRPVLWEKVVISAAINPLSAVLALPNGELVESPETRTVLGELSAEAIAVAAAEGYPLPAETVQKVERVCRQTGTNLSSMLQDIQAGRETEIEAISGELLRRGGAHGLALPATATVYRLLKAKEAQRYGASSDERD